MKEDHNTGCCNDNYPVYVTVLEWWLKVHCELS